MELRQRIWNLMGPERRLAAAQAFLENKDQKAAQTQGDALLAQRLHARPVFIRRLPPEKKAAYLSRDMALNAYLWDAVMISYQFSAHRQMLVDFLDAIGIPHKDGHYEGADKLQPPTAETLENGVRELLAKYDRTDVLIYLGAVVIQDATFWANLQPIVDRLESEQVASSK
jgi:hypothetical protein